MRSLTALALCLCILFSCSARVIDTNYILSSPEMQKEMEIFNTMRSTMNESADEKNIVAFLTRSAEDFVLIKKFFLSIKTDHEHLKKAVEAQLKICGIFEKIKTDIDAGKPVIGSLRQLYYSDAFYAEFVAAMKAARDAETAKAVSGGTK